MRYYYWTTFDQEKVNSTFRNFVSYLIGISNKIVRILILSFHDSHLGRKIKLFGIYFMYVCCVSYVLPHVIYNILIPKVKVFTYVPLNRKVHEYARCSVGEGFYCPSFGSASKSSFKKKWSWCEAELCTGFQAHDCYSVAKNQQKRKPFFIKIFSKFLFPLKNMQCFQKSRHTF